MSNNTGLIPKNIMEALRSTNTKGNREVIIDYLVSEPGAVELTELQKELLNRWNAADDLLRQMRHTTKEVACLLNKKFEYDISTAWRDIADARYVFGSTRPSNKKYLLLIHTDRIEATMLLLQKQGDFKNLKDMYQAYTNAVDKLPDDTKIDTAAPPVIFNIQLNNYSQLTQEPVTDGEAWEIANEEENTDENE